MERRGSVRRSGRRGSQVGAAAVETGFAYKVVSDQDMCLGSGQVVLGQVCLHHTSTILYQECFAQGKIKSTNRMKTQ
jgi:hypothetical protein